MPVSQKLLIIGSVWPEPDSSAAGQRIMQLIQLFQSAGWDITFASSALQRANSVNLQELDVDQVSIEINDSSFDDFISNLQPAMVMFDRFNIEEQFGWRVAEQCPDAMRMLDTEDLHCLRRARRKAMGEGRKFTTSNLLQSDSAKREIASILRCDLSLIISEYEMKLLQELFEVDDTLLHYVPFLFDLIDNQVTKKWLPFDERCHFVTIGNFQHAPNMDGVEYLSKSVWPKIRKQLPKAELHVYGAYPTQQAQLLHQPENGFYIQGRAQDAAAVMRNARICLAPLRFGAGLKGKLTEAMQCGTPSVTTPVGAEGLAGELEWSGTVAEGAEDLADAAINLYTNLSLWKKAQEQGRRIINARFQKKEHGSNLIQQIEIIRARLPVHRSNNFYGAMLMHHTAASTKYMSRWIEEKNRPNVGS